MTTVDNKKVVKVETAELKPVADLRTKMVEAATAAEKAVKEAKLAELEFRVGAQQLYIEKGLDKDCRIDLETGVVTWPPEEPAVPAQAPVEEKQENKEPAK